MKYGVLVESNSVDLATEVNKHLAEGWKLQGGVSVRAVTRNGNSEGTVFAQAMTHDD